MPRSPLVPAFLLAIILVCAKVVIAAPLPRTPALLLATTAEDVAWALAFAAAAAVALRAASRNDRLARVTWFAVLASGALFVLLAVVHIAIFRAMGYPLTARMFGVIGRFADMRSSIAERATPAMVTAALAAPLLFVLLSHFWRPALLRRRAAAATIATLALAWIAAGLGLRAGEFPDPWRRRAKSPHRELVTSLAVSLLPNQRATIKADYPPGHSDDFKPARDFARPPRPQLSPPPRNVIVVVLESTAAQYLSAYGSPHDTTPNLRAESRHAIVFDRFYANAGYTFQSMVPLVNSVYPGLPWSYRTEIGRPVPRGLAGVLADRGYRTAFLAAANPEWGGMDWRAKDAGFAQVFGPTELGGPRASSWGTEDGALVDGLIRWIDAEPGKPFFAMAWTDQTHDPYTLSDATPPVDFLDESTVRNGPMFERYLNAIRQADHHLGRLFRHLRDRDLADDTLVVVTGDHGEAFAHDHDVLTHGLALYDECQRVPLILWNPRLVTTPRRVTAAGSHVDLNPTLADLLGVDPPADWRGASLFSPDHPGRAYMSVAVSGFQFAVVDDRYKYILHVGDGFEQLFDLNADPREQHDLARDQPDRAARYRARVSAFVDSEERALKSR